MGNVNSLKLNDATKELGCGDVKVPSRADHARNHGLKDPSGAKSIGDRDATPQKPATRATEDHPTAMQRIISQPKSGTRNRGTLETCATPLQPVEPLVCETWNR